MSMEALQERIGYRFHDKALLERALIHSSYANESRQKIECNERMEFLGDAVLSIIVADHIFHKFHLAEGDLTRIRASLVCERACLNLPRRYSWARSCCWVMARSRPAAGSGPRW